MSSAVHSAIHLPYIKLFAFLSPLFVQALLLHPAFPSSVSTPVRLALAGPTAYLALTAPRHQGFEPRERCTGLNAVLAMVCVYASWKAIEWGTARDTTVYRWVGFDGGRRAESETASAPTLKARSNGSGGNPRRRVNKVQQRVESSTSIPSPSTTSIYSVLASTIHLCTSMRGPGYAWNDYSSRTTTPRRSPAAFLLRTLMFLLINHLAFIPLSIAIATPYSQRIDFVSTTLPSSFSPYTIHCFAESLSYTVFGLAAWTGISLGYYITTLAYFVLHSTLASLSLCGSFDSREYPPLFDRPAFPWSVKSYWGQQWHQLLRRCLVYMAWDPLVWIVGDVLGRSEAEAHAVGALGVFVLTAWAHEYAITCSLYGLPLATARTTILERYGCYIFFLLMWLASTLETLFTRFTRVRVRGVAGFVWAAGFQGSMGVFLYAAWANLGFTHGIPPVERWSWQRFVYPLMSLAPSPLFEIDP